MMGVMHAHLEGMHVRVAASHPVLVRGHGTVNMGQQSPHGTAFAAAPGQRRWVMMVSSCCQ